MQSIMYKILEVITKVKRINMPQVTVIYIQSFFVFPYMHFIMEKGSFTQTVKWLFKLIVKYENSKYLIGNLRLK